MKLLNYFKVHKNKKPKKAKYSEPLTSSEKIAIEKALEFFKGQTKLLKLKKS